LPLFPSSRGRAAAAVGAVAVGFSCPVGQKGQVFWKNYFSNQKAFFNFIFKTKYIFSKIPALTALKSKISLKMGIFCGQFYKMKLP